MNASTLLSMVSLPNHCRLNDGYAGAKTGGFSTITYDIIYTKSPACPSRGIAE
jgi:hypothetical protein